MQTLKMSRCSLIWKESPETQLCKKKMNKIANLLRKPMSETVLEKQILAISISTPIFNTSAWYLLPEYNIQEGAARQMVKPNSV